MTQILLYQANDGIALATDSRAVAFDQEGKNLPSRIEVQKLFQLSSHVIAVTGGAGYGILLCKRFQRYTKQAALDNLEDILDVAPGFFGAEAEAFHHKNTLARSELDRLYVVIAGYVPHQNEKPFRFLFLASENPDDSLHVVETSHILAIPRQVGMEYRLAQLPPTRDLLDKVESLFESFLQKLAESDADIGPPFHFVRITSKGIEIRSSPSGHIPGSTGT